MTEASLIIENAKVLTMDPAKPRADAIALGGALILGVGEKAEMEVFAGPNTRRFDAQGKTVMPGMVEAHLHLFSGAYGLRLCQLDRVQGLDALREKVLPFAKANPDEGLLICKGAMYTLFGDKESITRQKLDQVISDRPLVVIAADHHTAFANTIAMEKAGLINGRDVPLGNEVVMGSDGTATGELREFEAYRHVMVLRTSGGRENLGLTGDEPENVTAAERAEDEAVMLEGLKYCASYGFTSLHNMDGNIYQLELLDALEKRGELLCRTEIPFHLTPSKPISSLETARQMTADYKSDRLRSGRVKMFMDGVIDSGTAVMVEDYADQPGWRGDPLHSVERFNEAATEADKHGLQIAVHAIGDAAVRRVLDGYEAAQKANGKRDSRHRIEHIEVLHPDDLHRFAELGVIASMQPQHPPGALDFPLEPWTSKVGKERWPWSFPVQYLRDEGVPIAFASDWPVADIDPMRGVQAAVTRKPWHPDHPSHASNLMQSLFDYTMGGAYAGFDEHRLGKLAPGMLADVVVMDADLESLAAEQIGTARAALTLCGGEITWEA
ncbi:amidohydrolase [Heliomarina baculiformis]|uniref:amidohydrolase n=1 Tax=Heliomarina baculiformis TaxID=2872036 RepID=UPI001EE188DB|nr:amidohydrolase [Heliomarina baculiformis]